MSASLAAARKRRGGIVESTPPPQPPQVSNVQPGQQAGLTLPQVIALVDKRLMILETFMKEQTSASQPLQPPVVNLQAQSTITTDAIKEEVVQLAEEFNNRYELLATEIQGIKDIILKLQSYTMEVNKTLMEERVRILSDLGQSNNIIIGEDEDEDDPHDGQ